MSALLIPCPHCAKPSQIDSDKLPDQRAFFTCPYCSGRVVVDKRKLVSESQASPAAPEAPPPAESVKPASPTPPQAEAPPPIASSLSAITPPAVEPTVPDRRFSKVPANAIFPSGIILGEDESAIGEVREALAALGSELELVGSPDEARQTIVNEQPVLCIYVAGRVETAPHPALNPLTGLHPSWRRRLYLMLVAENLKSFDAMAAFTHEVNMVLGTEDLPQIGAALFSGLEYHKRLYSAYQEASERKGSI